MSDGPAARQRFIEALVDIAKTQSSEVEMTANLHAALLDFGSHTPDNIECADAIEIGSVGDEAGLKLRHRDVLFCDIAHALEDMPLPASLKEKFPAMTDVEWAAFARLTTLIYVALDRPDERKD